MSVTHPFEGAPAEAASRAPVPSGEGGGEGLDPCPANRNRLIRSDLDPAIAAPPSNASSPRSAVPRHVAIIMDGNGRWARARRQPRTSGHSAGVGNIRRVLKWLEGHGVEYVTVFAFSTENWDRPPEEVSFLLDLLREALRTEVQELHNNNVRVLHIGQLDRLPHGFRSEIERAVQLTRNNTGVTFCVAFNYGGRDEIVEATRRIVADGVPLADIDEALLSRYMFSPDIPDPDLVIRTGGEFRISNFLLWQIAYSEFYSTPTPWPAFDEHEVGRAIKAYARRERRFGRVVDRPL